MDNQKVDNQLNLALDTPENEREKSLDLNVGYDSRDNVWELIVKHNGNLDRVRELDATVIELLNNYAIIRVKEMDINAIANMDEVIYIEKPKRLNFTILQGKRNSCINVLQSDSPDSLKLFGNGVIIAVIDSGIDYRHPAFINEDGTSKILEIWDQSIDYFYTNEQINVAIRSGAPLEPNTLDASGHGTAVASIASGVAPQSRLLIVKLGQPLPNTFPRTSELMRAVDYCVKRGVELNAPMVINLSFGNNYGAHNGSSLIETFIDGASQIGQTTIVVGTGNEAAEAIHRAFTLEQDKMVVELSVGQYETGLNLQLWKNYVDEVNVQVISPSGERTGVIVSNLGTSRYTLEDTYLLVYYGEPSPYSSAQEIYFDFIPRENYIAEGIWQFELYPIRIVDGSINMWLPTGASLNGTAFLRPSPELTITIPATSENVISVGAYNSFNDSYASFSGRGMNGKPDIVAPGVNIRCASPGGGYVIRSGTSMAAPFVSGSVALLNEWGIVRRNDRFLYGEKVKAYLISGARQLPGIDESPNSRTGWGALCVADSIRKRRG